MKKKFFYSTIVLIVISLCVACYTFAADNNTMLQNAADGVRNVVGGAENAMEDAARGVSNTSRNITGGMQNAGNNAAGTMGMTNTNSQENYTAERTATTAGTDNGTFLGIDSTTWIWIVMAIAALGIGVLIYSYFNQSNARHYQNSDE